MPNVKEQIRAFVDTLPDNVTMDDAIYQLYVADKVQDGLKAIERGEIVSQEDVETEFKKCLKGR